MTCSTDFLHKDPVNVLATDCPCPTAEICKGLTHSSLISKVMPSSWLNLSSWSEILSVITVSKSGTRTFFIVMYTLISDLQGHAILMAKLEQFMVVHTHDPSALSMIPVHSHAFP